MDRLPFQATAAGALYDGIATLPVAVLLDNVRSMYNVGAFFRTADAAAIEKLYLCGITSHPPKKEITKTALGAEDTVQWEHASRTLCPSPRDCAPGDTRWPRSRPAFTRSTCSTGRRDGRSA